MGIKNFHTWISQDPSLWKSFHFDKHKAPDKTWLVFDGNSFMYSLYKSKNYLYDFTIICNRITSQLNTLRSCGFTKLVFIFDGSAAWLKNGKINEKLCRSRDKCKQLSKLMFYLYLCQNYKILIKNHSDLFQNSDENSLKQVCQYIVTNILSNYSSIFYRGYSRWILSIFHDISVSHNIQIIISKNEADCGIADFANKNVSNVFGIVTNDTDFYVYNVDCFIINVDNMKCKSNICDIRAVHPFKVWKKLNLSTKEERMLFAQFKGCDLTNGKKIININGKLYENSVDNIAKYIVNYSHRNDQEDDNDDESEDDNRDELNINSKVKQFYEMIGIKYNEDIYINAAFDELIHDQFHVISQSCEFVPFFNFNTCSNGDSDEQVNTDEEWKSEQQRKSIINADRLCIGTQTIAAIHNNLEMQKISQMAIQQLTDNDDSCELEENNNDESSRNGSTQTPLDMYYQWLLDIKSDKNKQKLYREKYKRENMMRQIDDYRSKIYDYIIKKQGINDMHVDIYSPNFVPPPIDQLLKPIRCQVYSELIGDENLRTKLISRGFRGYFKPPPISRVKEYSLTFDKILDNKLNLDNNGCNNSYEKPIAKINNNNISNLTSVVNLTKNPHDASRAPSRLTTKWIAIEEKEKEDGSGKYLKTRTIAHRVFHCIRQAYSALKKYNLIENYDIQCQAMMDQCRYQMLFRSKTLDPDKMDLAFFFSTKNNDSRQQLLELWVEQKYHIMYNKYTHFKNCKYSTARPIDIHIQMLFLRCIEYLNFNKQLPGIHRLLHGPLYHFMCQIRSRGDPDRILPPSVLQLKNRKNPIPQSIASDPFVCCERLIVESKSPENTHGLFGESMSQTEFIRFDEQVKYNYSINNKSPNDRHWVESATRRYLTMSDLDFFNVKILQSFGHDAGDSVGSNTTERESVFRFKPQRCLYSLHGMDCLCEECAIQHKTENYYIANQLENENETNHKFDGLDDLENALDLQYLDASQMKKGVDLFHYLKRYYRWHNDFQMKKTKNGWEATWDWELMSTSLSNHEQDSTNCSTNIEHPFSIPTEWIGNKIQSDKCKSHNGAIANCCIKILTFLKYCNIENIKQTMVLLRKRMNLEAEKQKKMDRHYLKHYENFVEIDPYIGEQIEGRNEYEMPLLRYRYPTGIVYSIDNQNYENTRLNSNSNKNVVNAPNDTMRKYGIVKLTTRELEPKMNIVTNYSDIHIIEMHPHQLDQEPNIGCFLLVNHRINKLTDAPYPLHEYLDNDGNLIEEYESGMSGYI